MDFARLAARLVVDEVYPVQFPDIAVQALLDGAEAPSFVLLAGESGSAPPDELRALLVAALAESGTPIPDPVAAARTLTRDCAQQVVSGALSPIDGAQRILGLFHKIESLLPPSPNRCATDTFGIARLYVLEDAWCESWSERSVLEAELREECARLARE
jgi:hypothetical protein